MGSNIKRLAIIGSTGSIGQQTLDIVRAFPERLRVVALAAGENIERLTAQIVELKPDFVYYHNYPSQPVSDEYETLSLEDIASHPDVDTVVIATSGKSGLEPILAAARAGKNIALANKESLVMAGEIITREAKANFARILPVDSEHSAIWQCLSGETQAPNRILLTASGGPFRQYSPVQLKEVSAEQALRHPTWRMGPKVTIDSATLMNKGLEVIEARWLFAVPINCIEVLIHPQSIIHSMVEFADGSIKAQLNYPDMRFPIQYALFHPERLANPSLPSLDLSQINTLTLEAPDPVTFPCLTLATSAGEKGGTYPAVLCAADEVAISLFLSGRIRFTDIPGIVEQVLEQHQSTAEPDLEEILAADTWARERALILATGAKP